MAIKYDQVKNLWDYLADFHGLAFLERFMEFELETVREIFIKCRPLWCGNVEDYQHAMKTAQVLTVLSFMTCEHRERGEFGEWTTFVKMEDMTGPFVQADASPWPEMLQLLFNPAGRQLLKSEVKSGRRDFIDFFESYGKEGKDQEVKHLFAEADKLLANLESALDLV